MLLYSCVLLCIVAQIQSEFVVPDVKIEALKTGLRVSIPDAPGIQLFEFHANINKDIKGKDLGDIFNRVSSAYKGYWMFTDKDVILKEGDVLHYWVTVYSDRMPYGKHDLSFKVEDLSDE